MCHKIIKLDYLYEMGGDDTSFIIEMIDLFVVQSDDVIGDIKLHYQNNDLKNLKKVLHKLKSSANLFQIIKLVEIIVDFESKSLETFSKDALSNLVNDVIIIVKTSKDQLILEKANLLGKN